MHVSSLALTLTETRNSTTGQDRMWVNVGMSKGDRFGINVPLVSPSFKGMILK